MMIDPSKYTIIVRKGLFDSEECFEARVAELPDVTEYADSFDEAYTLALDTIETTAAIFEQQGKIMPLPFVPSEEYNHAVRIT